MVNVILGFFWGAVNSPGWVTWGHSGGLQLGGVLGFFWVLRGAFVSTSVAWGYIDVLYGESQMGVFAFR